MMEKYISKTYVYIDDSGNPGLSKNSHSENFIIASVIIVGNRERDVIEAAIRNYLAGLGWNSSEELKFHKTNKRVIRDVIKNLAGYNYEAYAIVLNKATVDRTQLPSTKRESIMMFSIKELLIKLGLENIEVVIDGSYGPKFIKQARAYLRQNLKKEGVENCKVRFVDSRKSPLVQLADLVAGAVARSFTTKTDAKDYVKAFGEKIKGIYKL